MLTKSTKQPHHKKRAQTTFLTRRHGKITSQKHKTNSQWCWSLPVLLRKTTILNFSCMTVGWSEESYRQNRTEMTMFTLHFCHCRWIKKILIIFSKHSAEAKKLSKIRPNKIRKGFLSDVRMLIQNK